MDDIILSIIDIFLRFYYRYFPSILSSIILKYRHINKTIQKTILLRQLVTSVELSRYDGRILVMAHSMETNFTFLLRTKYSNVFPQKNDDITDTIKS